MHIGDLGPIELGMIAVVVLLLAAGIYWRIRLRGFPKRAGALQRRVTVVPTAALRIRPPPR